MEHYFIYALIKEGIVFYIGLTTKVEERISNHKTNHGHDLVVEILQEYTGSFIAASALEQFWIKKYIDLGFKLINKNLEDSSKPPKQCAYCGKTIFQSSGKREKKFCSVSCRVMNNRKFGKKMEVTKLDVQMLFNEFKAAIQGFNMQAERLQQPKVYNSFENNGLITTSNPQSATVTINRSNYGETQPIKRSYDWYKQARIDCATNEDWLELKEMILADEYLTEKEKYNLTIKPVSN